MRCFRWEARSLIEHLKNPQRQAIYAVLHGSTDPELRMLSFEYLSQLPFDGFAIGGSLGRTKEEMNEVLRLLSPHLHSTHKPVHLLGILDSIHFIFVLLVFSFPLSFFFLIHSLSFSHTYTYTYSTLSILLLLSSLSN
jgi:tRNA-guanine family transglycosylase